MRVSPVVQFADRSVAPASPVASGIASGVAAPAPVQSPSTQPLGAPRPPTPFAAPWDTAGQSFIFTGAKKTLMLVRYTASQIPVYDELLLAEPRVVNGIRGSMVTHMYVSNQISVDHGRGIWHLPKKMANFTWKTNAEGHVSVAVQLPGQAKPFFQATISKPAQWLGVPARLLPQPPLLQSDLFDGTSDIYRTQTQLRGMARPAHLLHYETDGAELPCPDLIRVMSWGANLEPMKFHIAAPELLRPETA